MKKLRNEKYLSGKFSNIFLVNEEKFEYKDKNTSELNKKYR